MQPSPNDIAPAAMKKMKYDKPREFMGGMEVADRFVLTTRAGKQVFVDRDGNVIGAKFVCDKIRGKPIIIDLKGLQADIANTDDVKSESDGNTDSGKDETDDDNITKLNAVRAAQTNRAYTGFKITTYESDDGTDSEKSQYLSQ